MSKFSRKLYDLMNKSLMEENEPVQLSFTNRIYKKYGNEFIKKYDYISGRNMDYIADKLKNKNVTQLSRVTDSTQASILSSMTNSNMGDDLLNSKNEDYIPSPMYVPEEVRKEWVDLDTKKYFLNDENKRELLEEYLSTLSEVNRKKAVAVMCENSNSKNYYRFLDLSTTAYTPNQEMLSNDLIKYFENKYLNEYIDKQEAMKRYNNHIFSKQETLEKKESGDEVYQETVMNQNYFNPYDKNEMISAKVSEQRQFLDNQKEQNELFDMIDKNSSYYLKQQTEFNNDHLNIKNIFNNNKRQLPNSIVANNEIQEHQPIYVQENLNNYEVLNNQFDHNTNHLNQSLIVEIPQVDNIADFIKKREMLNYENTLRKNHNINIALDFNNEITNTNLQYKLVAQPEQSHVSKTIDIANGADINHSALNTINAQQTIQEPITITNDNVVKHQLPINNNQNAIKVIKIARNAHSYGLNQLDPNERQNNRFEQIKEDAFQQHNDNASPNEQYLQQRYDTAYESHDIINPTYSNNTYSSNNRFNEFKKIQSFFTTKPAVVKPKYSKTLEVSEEIKLAPRKMEARTNSKKQTSTRDNNTNALVVRPVKINRGILVSNQKTKSVPKNTTQVEAKRVLV